MNYYLLDNKYQSCLITRKCEFCVPLGQYRSRRNDFI